VAIEYCCGVTPARSGSRAALSNEKESKGSSHSQAVRTSAIPHDARGRRSSAREAASLNLGPEYGNELEYLRTFVRQLRLKIEDDPANPKYLITDSHFGYRFAEPGPSVTKDEPSI
jgi:hypothetical protein